MKCFEERPSEMTVQQRVAGIYLMVEGKILFLRRAKSQKGTRGIPKGKTHSDGDPKNAVIRELHEETGISIIGIRMNEEHSAYR